MKYCNDNMPTKHTSSLPEVYTSETPTQEEINNFMTTAMCAGVPGPGYTGWVPKNIYDSIQKLRLTLRCIE